MPKQIKDKQGRLIGWVQDQIFSDGIQKYYDARMIPIGWTRFGDSFDAHGRVLSRGSNTVLTELKSYDEQHR